MRRKHITALDQLLIAMSHGLETLTTQPVAKRVYPGEISENDALTQAERDRSARYMRVNHVGEICAQALYESQALTARSEVVKTQMQQSALEEIDHLAWCEQRINELGGRKSLLNPLWYAGSFTLGTMAGIAGDKWNLGFVAETERQVVAHLETHLGALPEKDQRSREVISQMKTDENIHAQAAITAGANPLPAPIKRLMGLASKVMTNTAHWI
ncbi:MAG: 2-polyprenyl-3-methyl-6-methoxy-1,4-benzoquinone monooxygenase [Gammaproteobacteria bacterium]|nr:2-polyprenyl-3-methyl-6-methoxy-1,4-benzoquinone monooxygenase [Gammaproteobacteria bacterium]